MIVVLDASVVVKLLVEDPAREPDTDEAFGIFSAISDGKLGILQPVHWLAEVAAVAARLSPKSAVRSVAILSAMEFPTTAESSVMQRAVELAIATGQHLFDTLYQAVALEHPDTWLVTADDRYRLQAEHFGRIAALRHWARILDPV